MRSWRCRNKKLKVEFMHFNILCWSKQGREPKISLSILFLPFALANLFLNPHFCLSLFNNSHNLSYIIKFSIFFITVKKKKKKVKPWDIVIYLLDVAMRVCAKFASRMWLRVMWRNHDWEDELCFTTLIYVSVACHHK